MNGRAGTSIVAAALAALLWPSSALAQATSRPTPPPIATAEQTPWYLGAEPITFAGNIYYPAGPQVFFNRYEMIRSGFYEGVALYTRTTIEPFSMVFVPVGGGLMQPYERRRAGDIAGTAGSTTPAFPIVTPAEEATDRSPELLPQAAAPPMRVATSIGDTSRELTHMTPGTGPGFHAAPRAPVATNGTASAMAPATAATPPGPLRSALPPTGLNAIFINYEDRQWFSSGPVVEFSSTRFVRVKDYRGFPVYSEPGKDGRVYVALKASGDGLLTPYSVRR